VAPAASEAYIEVSNESGGGWSVPAFPDSLVADEYSFTTVWPAGLEQSLDFHNTAEGMELRLSSYRLRRTSLE
jgi:hypothetical protein